MKQDFGNLLKSAFESGYSNASLSLSQMINDQIKFNSFLAGSYKLNSEEFTTNTNDNHHGSRFLLTTEIFGDTSGKSYLILSDDEFKILTGSIPDSRDPNINLKEEFIKEMDNILSASVITKLSDQLNRKMYGDVPILVGKVNGKIEDIIYDDFSEQTEEVYINSMFFSFENHPSVNPVFIWVIDVEVESMKEM